MTVTPSSGVTVEKSDDPAQGRLNAVILKVKETLGNTAKVAIKIVMKENWDYGYLNVSAMLSGLTYIHLGLGWLAVFVFFDVLVYSFYAIALYS